MTKYIIQRFYYPGWVDYNMLGVWDTLEEARTALLEDALQDPNGFEWATGKGLEQDGRNWRIVKRDEVVYEPFE